VGIKYYEQWIFNAQTRELSFAGTVLWTFFTLNLLLGTFNLLPLPPLDGSTVIMLFMDERTAQRYLDWLRGSSYVMVGLLIAIVGFRYIYEPLSSAVIHAFFGR
jgi:Zn-dependent protease